MYIVMLFIGWIIAQPLAAFAQVPPPASAPAKATAIPAQRRTVPLKPQAPAMTNTTVIRMVKAGISDAIIIQKIRESKTNFDTSPDGLIALKEGGASDSLLAVIMNPAGASTAAPAAGTPLPAQPTAAAAPPVKRPEPAPGIAKAPENYGMYVYHNGGLKPIGRLQTKVQVSKFRSLLKNVPFVRQKIDINVPGAHSTARFEALRPTFYAFFPPSRDVSKFKLLQSKITGQKFDQRTIANASILFSTEQNQDEVICDVGPTPVKDLYKITPRENLPAGEFAFVEGNTGSKSSSNIDILDVYDFGIDRKEEKLDLRSYLATLPAVPAPGDTAFMSWDKEKCQKIVEEREAVIGLSGSMMGWFKRQFTSLDVYWVDDPFAQAFTRLEMLDRQLTPEEANKLYRLLVTDTQDRYLVLVSIGRKIGSGRLIGANEGERLMRPFDAMLTNNKAKDLFVPAQKLEFVGGYAGLWKVLFGREGVRGPLTTGAENLLFEARLNQNLDFKATFKIEKLRALQESAPGASKP